MLIPRQAPPGIALELSLVDETLVRSIREWDGVVWRGTIHRGSWPMNDGAMALSSGLDRDFIDAVVGRQAGRPGALLGILQQVQNHHPRKFLPMQTLEYIGARTGIPLSRIYSVATFFALFNLEPQGLDTVSVCRGTACHTRGSRDLLEKLMMHYGFQTAETDQLSITTPDGNTTLRTVACFGQCALAPVIEINHAIFGHMNEQILQRELDAMEHREPKT
jgi:NADH-quinone oxidoreductase subunit E